MTQSNETRGTELEAGTATALTGRHRGVNERRRPRLVVPSSSRRHAKAAAVVGALAVGSLSLAACTFSASAALPVSDAAPAAVAPAPDCGVPSEGKRVVLLVSGGVHEPRPSLTAQAEQKLRAAADSTDVSDGRGGKGSIAVIASADGQPRQLLPLTPRRASCVEEHGLQRDKLINDNIDRVRAAVAARSAARPGLDLLAGIHESVRGFQPGELIIISNGMSTEGGFDLRRVGWQLAPDALVAQLNERKLLNNLLPGWTVLFTGLGDTAGDAQPPLTKPARDTLTAYWSAICREAAPGGTCQFDQSPLDPAPPIGSADMPVIDVPGFSSATGPDGRITTTLEGSVLFAGDSAVLSPDAPVALRGVSARIANKIALQPDTVITIRGFVADPPSSTPQGRQRTSDERAGVVSEFIAGELAAHGLAARIDASGAGTPPGMTATVNGVFDEDIAAQMRKATVTY